MSRARRAIVFTALGAGLAAALLAGVTIGAVRVPIAEVLRMAARALGFAGVPLPDATHLTIIATLRLPRVLAAALVGGSLAVAGVVMQGLFRNPMASPEILGISAGGSLGAVAVITTGLASSSVLVLPVATAAGALLVAALIYGIASTRGARRCCSSSSRAWPSRRCATGSCRGCCCSRSSTS